MFRSIFTKTLYGLRWSMLGWSVGVMAIVYLTMVLYPSFSQNGIEEIVNSVPDSLKSLVGNVADFKTIPGYIGQQIFGPNLYIITLIMTIMVFLGVSASEEADGRMQSLLSFPTSRTKVYIQKWLAGAFTVGIISLSVILALWLALVTIHEQAEFGRVWQSVFELILLNLAFGTIAFAAALFTGSKTLTILLTSIYTVGALFITTLAPSVEKLKTVDYLSLLHYYNNPQVMSNTINTKHLAVIVGATMLVFVIGWIGFRLRDVRTV